MTFTTSCIWLNLLIFVVSLAVLVKGSDWFIENVADVARRLRISEFIIGLTLVSIGTSLPELATNICAAVADAGGVAVGTIVGSNIANIALVLAAGIVLRGKIPVDPIVVKRDGLTMLGVFVLLLLVSRLWGGTELEPYRLVRWEGALFLVIFCGYIWYLIRVGKEKSGSVDDHAKGKDAGRTQRGIPIACVMAAVGLGMVFVGAKVMVDNVVVIALAMKVPKAVVAATVVAFGTSVPELAVTISGVLKKEHGIALGNIVGSCIFNIILVLGLTMLIRPLPVSSDMLYSTMGMIGIGALLLFFMKTKKELSRWEGMLFLLIYIAFIGYSLNQAL